ncbi:MAG: hypothetical protein JWP12_3232 [Bacteroidetes bacterium]|nr:hypothetical protein [Bacteroidota bacterium]
MKKYCTAYLFILMIISSCGNHQEQSNVINNKNILPDTLASTDAANQFFDVPEILPDSIQKLLEIKKFASKKGIDSLSVDAANWFYNLGTAENKFNYLLFIENYGSGSGSGGNALSVLKKINGKYYKIQSLFAFFDCLQQTVSSGNYDIALYYSNALFDHNCPVSINYKWNGKYYAPDGINYITSITNINYNWNMLEIMGIVSKNDLLPTFPFVKENNKLAHFNINKIDIDTLNVKNKKDERLFIFKNNCTDGVNTDHIWILKKTGAEYFLLTELNKKEPEELVLIPDKKKNYPDIIFGTDTLHWNEEKYLKK